MRFVPLGGFLGAGKTTTMLSAARLLEGCGERVSVVTNDQGADLVDTQLARAAGIDDVNEVTGGCFCCRFDDLADVIARLRTDVAPTVVIAEAVGSCTDLQSTVIRPMRQLHGDSVDVSPLVVVVDPLRYGAVSQVWERMDSEPDLAYLYRHQLDEADVIALNKCDLLDPSEIERITDDIRERFPQARVLGYSATTGEGLPALIRVWTGENDENAAHRPFEVDYERYGAAEAELAWTNQTFDLTAADGSFAPATWVERFLAAMSSQTADRDATVGHVKIRVTTADGATKASLTAAGEPATYDERHRMPARTATVTLNARVQMSPDELEKVIAGSAQAADAAVAASSGPRRGRIFRPGFPVPVHRM